MKTKFYIALALAAVVLGAGAASAGSEWIVDRFVRPAWFQKGLYIGKSNPHGDTKNKICGSFAAQQDYDAPSLADGVNNYFSMTLTGARPGDPCMVGFYEDGGATRPIGIGMGCEVLANDAVQVMIRFSSNDGGSVDLPDASYRPRVFSNNNCGL